MRGLRRLKIRVAIRDINPAIGAKDHRADLGLHINRQMVLGHQPVMRQSAEFSGNVVIPTLVELGRVLQMRSGKELRPAGRAIQSQRADLSRTLRTLHPAIRARVLIHSNTPRKHRPGNLPKHGRLQTLPSGPRSRIAGSRQKKRNCRSRSDSQAGRKDLKERFGRRKSGKSGL